MKKSALSLSLSLLWLAACTPAPTTPTPSPTATPTPTPAPTAPVFQGETTLKGKVAIDAQSIMVEASNATGTFRKSAAASNQNYQINNVPVGGRIRLQAQYQKNPLVILSALVDVGAEQKEKETTVDIDLNSTALELIYSRAAAQGKAAIVNTPLASFKANEAVKSYYNQVLGVLQEIFTTPVDAIVVVVPEAPKVVQTLDSVLPAIDALLQNQPVPSATPTPSSSVTPSPGTTPTPGPSSTPVFTPNRLVVKPGENVTIAKDTALRLWAVGLDAQNQAQPLSVIWNQVSANGQGNLGSDGVFTPLTPGTFVYTATYGTLTKTVTITVTDEELNSLEMVPDTNLTLNVGQKFELQAKGKDEKAREVTVTPTWELSNNFVASVDANGVLTPLQPGRVDITARARNYSATVTLTVESASTFLIEVAPDKPTVLTGKTQAIQVLGLDPTNNSTSPAFSFSVADSSIGRFLNQDTSINGITPTVTFQALKPGVTQVTVKDVITNQSSTFSMNVADGVPFITSMSPLNTSLIPGQTVTLVGENFSNSVAGNEVFFNNLRASVVSASNTSMLVTVPAGAFTGYINITSDGKRGNGFPYVINPRIDNVIPAVANEGDLVTITGQHFSTDNPAHNAVFFGSQRASLPINVSNSSMQVRVPSNVNSEVQVSLRVKGQISNFVDFELAGASIPIWAEKATAPTVRVGAMAEQLEGKIYVIGGYQTSTSDNLEVYDVTNDTWATKANLPTERTRSTTAVVDKRLFVIGGSGDASRVDRYDIDANTWTQRKSSDFSHVGAVAETYNGKIYVIGGEGSNGRIVEEYNPDSDTWKTLRNSPSRRFESASAILNGKIYVIGGGEDGAEDRITAYDIEEDEWIVGLTPMPKKLRKLSAALINNKIYVVGGEDDNGQESDSVYEYDPVANSWRTLRKLPSARSGVALAAISSRLHAIGGQNNNNDAVNTNFRGSL